MKKEKECEMCKKKYDPPYPTERLKRLSKFCSNCVERQINELDEAKRQEILNWEWECPEVFYKKINF